jgi:hypothetical protein
LGKAADSAGSRMEKHDRAFFPSPGRAAKSEDLASVPVAVRSKPKLLGPHPVRARAEALSAFRPVSSRAEALVGFRRFPTGRSLPSSVSDPLQSRSPSGSPFGSSVKPESFEFRRAALRSLPPWQMPWASPQRPLWRRLRQPPSPSAFLILPKEQSVHLGCGFEGSGPEGPSVLATPDWSHALRVAQRGICLWIMRITGVTSIKGSRRRFSASESHERESPLPSQATGLCRRLRPKRVTHKGSGHTHWRWGPAGTRILGGTSPR